MNSLAPSPGGIRHTHISVESETVAAAGSVPEKVMAKGSFANDYKSPVFRKGVSQSITDCVILKIGVQESALGVIGEVRSGTLGGVGRARQELRRRQLV